MKLSLTSSRPMLPFDHSSHLLHSWPQRVTESTISNIDCSRCLGALPVEVNRCASASSQNRHGSYLRVEGLPFEVGRCVLSTRSHARRGSSTRQFLPPDTQTARRPCRCKALQAERSTCLSRHRLAQHRHRRTRLAIPLHRCLTGLTDPARAMADALFARAIDFSHVWAPLNIYRSRPYRSQKGSLWFFRS